MPEGDTVWLAARRLHEALSGRLLTTADLRVPRFARTDLTGRGIREVLARGKHMLTRLDGDLSLHTHLRMDGSWQLARAGERWRGGPGHAVRAVLGNDRWQAIGYRLHDVVVLPTDAEATLVGHLGPDLLGPDWDPHLAAANLGADPGRAIGEALLDQRNLAGLGTVYETETLYLSGVTPWTPTADVAGRVDRIVATAHELITANREHPEQSTTGSLRRGESHWVYGRGRQTCRRCASVIRTARIGRPPQDRIAYWCPTCQSGPAPAVDSARRRSSYPQSRSSRHRLDPWRPS